MTYAAADFDPPFTFEPSVEWVATLHDGNRGRDAGEVTLRLGDVGVHFDQPGVSDVRGGEPVPAPETLDDFIAALETALELDVGDPARHGEATIVRIDAIVTDRGVAGWPEELFGVDELCVGPDAGTRFYLVELSERIFVAIPPCLPAEVTNEEWSAAVEPLLATLEEAPAR